MNETLNQIQDAETEASILLNSAMSLSRASTSQNQLEIVTALDNNLKLWVEIETSLKSAKNLLPDDIKNNLLSLSKFVEKMTLFKGVNMEKSDFDCLININMQISEGLLEVVKNNLAREEAFALLKCAIDLSSAREKGDEKEVVSALDSNMQLWVYLKTLAKSKSTKLPTEVKSNLIKLADYVAAKTLELGKNIQEINQKSLDSLIMTNLQISEGLMSRNKNAMCLPQTA